MISLCSRQMGTQGHRELWVTGAQRRALGCTPKLFLVSMQSIPAHPAPPGEAEMA